MPPVDSDDLKKAEDPQHQPGVTGEHIDSVEPEPGNVARPAGEDSPNDHGKGSEFSFELEENGPRLAELIEYVPNVGCPSTKEDFLAQCIAGGHRKHFFIRGGTSLRRRVQLLIVTVKSEEVVKDHLKAGKPQWTALCEGRPLSLVGILKLDYILQQIAVHPDAKVRSTSSVGQKPFLLSKGSVVPSIFYQEPLKLQAARVRIYGSARDSASVDIFGHNGKSALYQLERGSQGGQDYRVTVHAVRRVGEILGDDCASHFTYNAYLPDLKLRNGENTHALPISNGNMLENRLSPGASAQPRSHPALPGT